MANRSLRRIRRWIDVRPYLVLEAFEPVSQSDEFMKVRNGGYYIEWECGADLSADTVEAKLVEVV